MCGIFGELWFDPSYTVDSLQLLERCHLMSHRGPDGEGAWCERNIGLGHRRLAIIDLAGGYQPMSYADQRYWITFNGEIYNYRELRAYLESVNCVFQTNSDTEVILAAYGYWGESCPEHFNGIFAFGIWDRQEQTLFLARDHMGVKPLFYYADAHKVTFSSELKTLVVDPTIASGGLCQQAIMDYMALGYVLSPLTIVDQVYRLPPAHSLTVRDGQLRLRRYWDLASIVNQGPTNTRSDQAGQYFHQLAQTVQRQMVADVPVGAFLSGGIDSSTIVYLMKNAHPSDLWTFSIGFAEASYSELDYADQMAAHLGTQHHAEVVRPPTQDELIQMMWHYDEPLGDTSVIPTYFVSHLASQLLKVVLSGDGGDENLAGYDTYVADMLHRFYRRVPDFLHRTLIFPTVNALPSSAAKVNLSYQLKQFMRYSRETPEIAHFRWRQFFTDSERSALVPGSSGLQNGPLERFIAHYKPVAKAHPLNQALYVDMNTWLLDDILPKVDRASMATGLEARVPFLDPRMVEYTMGLAIDAKMQGFARKVILKKAMRNKLPRPVLTRKKRGFNSPVGIWMAGPLRELAEEVFHGASSAIDLESPVLSQLWREFLAGRADHSYKLWGALTMLIWEKHVWQPLTSREYHRQ